MLSAGQSPKFVYTSRLKCFEFKTFKNYIGSAASADCPKIISRAEWGARKARLALRTVGNQVMMKSYLIKLKLSKCFALSFQLPYQYVHHRGAGSPCYTTTRCKAMVRSIQNHSMDKNRYRDIAYRCGHESIGEFAILSSNSTFIQLSRRRRWQHLRGYRL